MDLFSTTLSQMAYLFSLILIGYLLVKLKVLSQSASSVLAKLENNVFIPALVLGTFIENFTVERLSSFSEIILLSFGHMVVTIPLSMFISRLCEKDKYTRNIFTYGLVFSNFSFMGNAVISSVFPDIFMEYLIFTIPLWTMIYVWGAPALLLSEFEGKQPIKKRLKTFLNPMFIAMVIGMIIGIADIELPKWLTSVVSASGDCMSPIAMLLTGITVSSINLKKTFTDAKIYIISIARLVIFPLIGIGLSMLLPLSQVSIICVVCSLAMPLGLNTIVIPSAYGKDTSVAAGMAIVSHLLSCITIPVIISILSMVLGV